MTKWNCSNCFCQGLWEPHWYETIRPTCWGPVHCSKIQLGSFGGEDDHIKMRLHTLHYIAIHAKHCPSVCCGWRCFWIRFHRLSVADKLLFSKPDKSDIKVGPAVEVEEEPQKKEDKGIWELSLMLDQPHQQSCSCGGFALDVMSTPIKWINLLRWGRCKFWGWVGVQFCPHCMPFFLVFAVYVVVLSWPVSVWAQKRLYLHTYWG